MMEANRLEAFSDGVIAIIITVMVLEMKVPHGADLAALAPVVPVFLTYVLSFAYLGIYWNNHHHMLKLTESIDGSVLWANLHLLFWLSLLPFTTGWMGENHFVSGRERVARLSHDAGAAIAAAEESEAVANITNAGIAIASDLMIVSS
jgi:uncharacterized membrane protein